MATEEGIVVEVNSMTARIKTTRSGTCQACASRGSCSTIGSGKEMEVEALNLASAQVGDQVVISFESSVLLKISFLLYVFPILCMIAGALIGQWIASYWGSSSSASAVIFGILFFMLAFVMIKFRSNKLAKRDDYRPKIIRILKKA